MKRSVRASVLAGCAVAVGAVAAPAQAVPSFYASPAQLPAQNGDLVRTESMKLGVSFGLPWQASSLPGRATRIMYKSTDANGLPVAVTGVYIEPSKNWSGPGDRPLVAYAEGTQGQGDACAPSQTLESTINFQSGSFGIGYEVPSIYGILDRGMAVVVTDYIGLGTERLHTYVDRKDMAHALLDAARAALDVDGASVTAQSPVGTYGYSQGGGASAAAAELAPTYAPDVNLKAGYAGAPPADLMGVLRTADGTSLTGVLGYAINGLAANNPELQTILDQYTNNAGKSALKQASTQCIGETLASFAYKKTSEWTTTRTSAATVVSKIPAAMAIVNEQRIGNRKPEVPMGVVTGTRDDIVGHQQAKQLAVDWCAKGVNVTYVPIVQYVSSFGTALNHLGPMIVNNGGSQDWLRDRLIGRPTSGNCSRVRWMR